jgi:hypothetical protein
MAGGVEERAMRRLCLAILALAVPFGGGCRKNTPAHKASASKAATNTATGAATSTSHIVYAQNAAAAVSGRAERPKRDPTEAEVLAFIDYMRQNKAATAGQPTPKTPQEVQALQYRIIHAQDEALAKAGLTRVDIPYIATLATEYYAPAIRLAGLDTLVYIYTERLRQEKSEKYKLRDKSNLERAQKEIDEEKAHGPEKEKAYIAKHSESLAALLKKHTAEYLEATMAPRPKVVVHAEEEDEAEQQPPPPKR